MSRCDFVVLNPEETHIDPELDILHRTSIRTIPVAFHIIHKTDATGYIQQSKLDAQITALNNAYSSLNIQFQKSSVDYTVNNDWFGIACGNFTQSECGTHPNHCEWKESASIKCQENNTFEDDFKSALSIDPTTTLNIYTGELGGTLGYAFLPTPTVRSEFGSGAKVLATTTDIGRVKSINVTNPGFDYSEAPKLDFRSNFVIKDITGTFDVGDA